MKQILTFIILLFTMPAIVFSTGNNKLNISGTVYEIPDRMDGCNIIVHQNGTPSLYTKSSKNGTFNVSLEFGNQYIIEFSYEGYVSKKLSVDTENNVEDVTSDKSIENLVIDLFQALPGEDYKVLEKPIAKIIYDPEKGAFSYDMAYNSEIQDKVQDLWNKVYNARTKRDENFESSMTEGDKFLEEKEYQEARGNYVDALTHRPMAVEPKEKIKYIDGLGSDISNKVADLQEIEISSDEIIEEKMETLNKIIIRRFVVKEDKSTTYRKVRHKFNGSEYFFRENTPITKVIWELETEVALAN